MITFGKKVSKLAEASSYCDNIEAEGRGDYCKIFTIFYRESFSDSDLGELEKVCSDTTKLSDDAIEVCYDSFASKCGVKDVASPPVCNEKMPIFYYHPFTGILSFYNDFSSTNYGYEIAQPENIGLCIERRSRVCIQNLFLTMSEDEMKLACESTKESEIEERCFLLMEKRLKEIQSEESEKASLETREKNESECTEKMLIDYGNFFGDQEVEERIKELLLFKCSSYAFWAERLLAQLNADGEINGDQLIQEPLEAWRHYTFLDTVYNIEVSKMFLQIFDEDTKSGLETLKEKIEGYKTELEDEKAEVDELFQNTVGFEGRNIDLIGESYAEFIKRADNTIEYVDRALYFSFGECPNNICELVEAEKAFKEEQSKPVFEDVDKFNRQAIPIRYLKKANIVGGYPDGTFKPDKTINRAELLKIVVESQFDEGTIEACIAENSEPGWIYMFFKDVPINEWYVKYVCMGKVHGIIKGYPDGTFQPGRAVNRVESVKIVMEALNFNIDDVELSVKPYGDTPVNEWFTPYVYRGRQMAIFSNTGYTFKPGGEITRGEISEILYRLLVISKLNENKYQHGLDIKMFQLNSQ